MCVCLHDNKMCLQWLASLFIWNMGCFSLENRDALTIKNIKRDFLNTLLQTCGIKSGTKVTVHVHSVALAKLSVPWISRKETWLRCNVPSFLLCFLPVVFGVFVDIKRDTRRQEMSFTRISFWHGSDPRPHYLVTTTGKPLITFQEIFKPCLKCTLVLCLCFFYWKGPSFSRCLYHWQPTSTFPIFFFHGQLALVCTCAKVTF